MFVSACLVGLVAVRCHSLEKWPQKVFGFCQPRVAAEAIACARQFRGAAKRPLFGFDRQGYAVSPCAKWPLWLAWALARFYEYVANKEAFGRADHPSSLVKGLAQALSACTERHREQQLRCAGALR